MTITSGALVSVDVDSGAPAPIGASTDTPVTASSVRYWNRVWDTQKSGGAEHYWETDFLDVNGLDYDGPGTWGVDTSQYVAFPLPGIIEIDEAGIESNLWAPPEIPHAQDDEFDQSTIDAAWSVYAKTDASAGSFSFDSIDAYDTSFTSGTVLRAILNGDNRPSWLQLQVPSTKAFSVTKAYTFPTNVLILARLRFAQYYSSTTDEDGKIGIGFWEDDSGVDLDNGLELYLNEPDSGAIRAEYAKRTSGTPSGVTNTTDVDAQGQALEYVAIHKIGTTYHAWVGTASGNWIWLGSQSDSRTFGHVGFLLSNATNTTPAPRVVGVDFIRFFETDNFLL
jgi:hypothetical protein